LKTAALALVCALAALSAGCGKQPEKASGLNRVKLPGFSIELPEGEVANTSISPTDGKHEVTLPKPNLLEKTFEKMHDAGKVEVEWSSQSYSQEEWKTLLLPAMIQTFDVTIKGKNEILKQGSAGKDRWLYVIGQPHSPVGVGVINCDPAFSVTLSLAHYRDVERQFDELQTIVKSVECAVTAANRERPLAATRLPEKFGRTPDREVQTYQSFDGEQLVINFTSSDMQRNPTIYRHLIRGLLASALRAEIPESQLELLAAGDPRPAGKSSLMRANFPATHESIYIGTLYCPKLDLSLISMWTSRQSSEQLARERQSQVGCPGDESTPTSDFASLADAACARGESRFCGLKEMPE
jgi:hypothetical protein